MPKTALGSTAYLFHSGSGYANHCVISTHGGYGGGGTFVPDTEARLVFYSDHGSVVVDFGIDHFLSKVYKAKETVTSPNRCYNYQLSKYQNSERGGCCHTTRRNGSGENYSRIEAAVTRNERMRSGMLSFLESSRKFRQASRTSDTVGLLDEVELDEISIGDVEFEHPFDVVTVRNRWWMDTINLETVLGLIEAEHQYDFIHCFFCRGNRR